MALQKYTKEWLEELCANSYSLAEVLRKAGRKQAGGNQETLKKKIAEFGIDTSHFTGMLWNKGKTKETDNRISSREQYQLEEIFCLNSPATQKVLRGYVERHNILEYKCQFCGCDGN
jgi:restriction endonuclease Mrr